MVKRNDQKQDDTNGIKVVLIYKQNIENARLGNRQIHIWKISCTFEITITPQNGELYSQH